MIDIIWNIAAFIFAIAILVTFHEWGHFLVARLFKIDVLRFSFGFGKALWQWQSPKGTTYMISALPLGGYVKMLDEREGPVPADRLDYAFNRQSVAKRLLVVAAGPMFNFIFAFLAYWAMFIHGIEFVKPIVDTVEAHSPAQLASLKAGDELIAINGNLILNWEGVIDNFIQTSKTQPLVTIKVKSSDNTIQEHKLDLSDWRIDSDNPFSQLGIHPYRPKIKPVIESVVNGGAAALAGLQANDQIISVAGKKIDDWVELVNIIQSSPKKTLDMVIRRDGADKQVQLTPKAKVEEDNIIGFAGIKVLPKAVSDDHLRTVQFNPLAALPQAWHKTVDMTQFTLTLLYKMATGFISPNVISGPIGIAQGAGASASGGVSHYLNFLALISISLALLNFLPIPVLDGGHILYYLIESIRGRPLSENVQAIGFKIGLLFIISLMVLAFYNDIVRLLQ